MPNKLSLNNETLSFSEKDLPCLITYNPHVGGSQFSVALAADLFLNGSKILFLTAYHMATDDFLKRTKEMKNDISIVESTQDIASHNNARAILLKSGDENLFREALNLVPDISERILFLKNFEIVGVDTIKAILQNQKVILSGDVDTSSSKEQISNKQFRTIIAFSKPEVGLPISVPQLEKYTGFLKSNDKEGLVRLNMED